MRRFPKEPGSIDFNLIVKLLAEAVYFTARFYVELGLTDQIINIYCRVNGLDGIALDGLPVKTKPPVFQGKSLSIQLERSAADLVSSPESHAERLLTMFFERFGLKADKTPNLLKIIHKFQRQ
jgi:hypothetical protein